MRNFKYDPAQSFTAYLRKMTRNAWLDMQHARRDLKVGYPWNEMLESESAGNDLADFTADLADQEIQSRAMMLAQLRVTSQTWDSFYKTTIEHGEPIEVANQLGVTLGCVYQSRFRVINLLREIVASLNSM